MSNAEEIQISMTRRQQLPLHQVPMMKRKIRPKSVLLIKKKVDQQTR